MFDHQGDTLLNEESSRLNSRDLGFRRYDPFYDPSKALVDRIGSNSGCKTSLWSTAEVSSSCRNGVTAMRAGELEDRLDEHGVSNDHIAALFTEERDLQFPIAPLSPAMLERRCEVLAFLQVTLANLQWPVDEVFFAAQVMDSAGIRFEDDVRVQVVSGISALYMCLKLRANPQEADRGNPLRELAEHASQFLLQNVDEREVQLKEVIKEEMQLLTSLNYSLPTSTVATWIEVFCTRTDVTGGNATPFLRFTSDVAKELCRSLVHQTTQFVRGERRSVLFQSDSSLPAHPRHTASL